MYQMSAPTKLSHPRRILCAAMILGLTILGSETARASVISSTPDPLPLGAVFAATNGGAGCFQMAGVCAEGGILSYSHVTSTFDASGQELQFSAVLTTPLTDLSNKPLGTVSLAGAGSETVFGRTSANQTGSWMTQITSLDLTGTLNGRTLQAVQDTDNKSTGQTTIAAFGNEFQITSFFDIFVDIALATSPPLTTGRGPLAVALVPAPEPASLALLVLPLIGLAALRRYRTR